MKRHYEVTIDYFTEAETIEDGKKDVSTIIEMLGIKQFSVKHIPPNRTEAQNRALHLYFTMISEQLNDAGYDVRKTLKNAKNVPWTAERFKELFWRPIQKHITGKNSSKKLKSHEIDKVYDVVSKIISEDTSVYVPFPCEEQMINQYYKSIL